MFVAGSGWFSILEPVAFDRHGDLNVGTLLGNLNGKLTQLLRELRWREASTVARELEQVARQLQIPSNDLCEAWLLLVEPEFHELAQKKDDCGDVDVSRLRELLDRAAGARTHSPLADHEARLASQSALWIELPHGPDEALQFLGTPTDVRRVRAVLGICLRANRDREAVNLIRNRVPEEKWLDLATLLFARLSVEDEFSTAEDHDTQKPVVEFRRELMAPERLLPWLRRTLELSVAEQYLLMVSFREIATVTSAGDDSIADWVSETNLMV